MRNKAIYPSARIAKQLHDMFLYLQLKAKCRSVTAVHGPSALTAHTMLIRIQLAGRACASTQMSTIVWLGSYWSLFLGNSDTI